MHHRTGEQKLLKIHAKMEELGAKLIRYHRALAAHLDAHAQERHWWTDGEPSIRRHEGVESISLQ